MVRPYKTVLQLFINLSSLLESKLLEGRDVGFHLFRQFLEHNNICQYFGYLQKYHYKIIHFSAPLFLIG